MKRRAWLTWRQDIVEESSEGYRLMEIQHIVHESIEGVPDVQSFGAGDVNIQCRSKGRLRLLNGVEQGMLYATTGLMWSVGKIKVYKYLYNGWHSRTTWEGVLLYINDSHEDIYIVLCLYIYVCVCVCVYYYNVFTLVTKMVCSSPLPSSSPQTRSLLLYTLSVRGLL